MNVASPDTQIIIINVLLSALGILLVAIGFFIRALIVRLEAGNNKLSDLDKGIAVILAEFEAHKDLTKTLQDDNKRLNREIEGVRETRHDMVDHYHKLELRILTLEERSKFES